MRKWISITLDIMILVAFIFVIVRGGMDSKRTQLTLFIFGPVLYRGSIAVFGLFPNGKEKYSDAIAIVCLIYMLVIVFAGFGMIVMDVVRQVLH